MTCGATATANTRSLGIPKRRTLPKVESPSIGATTVAVKLLVLVSSKNRRTCAFERVVA